MTQKDGIALLNRLQDDPTRKHLKPMMWLTNHRTDVRQLIDSGQLGDLSERVDIPQSIIQRWLSQHPERASTVEPIRDGDLPYWRGYAAAMEKVVEMMTRKGGAA